MATHSPVRPSPPRFAPLAVAPEPLAQTQTPTPTPAHAIPPPRISGVQLVVHEAPAIVMPKIEPLPVLSIPPFDGAQKRRRGMIVVVTMLLLVVGAFVATAVASQLAH